jgi:hypothetical protein
VINPRSIRSRSSRSRNRCIPRSSAARRRR